ncbi:hypothetical protein MB46_03475 [Arthrobacter alpinus]|uniref:hypothetical protein n=1 Tax=Arthrobacter alpinus TaxID=656366 RepID=UPI0005CB7DB0|nr:hypothetical protein [Arthrobacter alpinus]ALV44712.1 hypothetical protein MB46_03475 [Arthrobacter alpinus]
MTEIAERQRIEDLVLMAHAYAAPEGATAGMDAAEATIKGRRSPLAPEYLKELRERVVFFFMAEQTRDIGYVRLGESVRVARRLEAHLWAEFRARNKNLEN